MRIFQTLAASATSAVPSNRTWYRNLYEPLLELGHEVVLHSAEDGVRARHRNDPALRARFSQQLLDAFRREHARKPFDLFFAYLWEGTVEPGCVDEIRRSGVPTCNFSCNNAHQFYLVKELCRHFDYSLHSEKDAREKFIEAGGRPLWWPMASNPKYFRPENVPQRYDATFVGGSYGLRSRYLARLLEAGVDAHAFGPAWQFGARTALRARVKRGLLLAKTLVARTPGQRATASSNLALHDFNVSLGARFPQNLHPVVSDEELVRLYSASRVSLGFLDVFDGHDPSRAVLRHLHLREFEAPMSGALYCTGHLDELGEFFDLDKEIATYRDEGELVDKVRFLLAHPEDASRIREAGHRRALADHTYHRRFEQLFRQLGLAG